MFICRRGISLLYLSIAAFVQAALVCAILPLLHYIYPIHIGLFGFSLACVSYLHRYQLGNSCTPFCTADSPMYGRLTMRLYALWVIGYIMQDFAAAIHYFLESSLRVTIRFNTKSESVLSVSIQKYPTRNAWNLLFQEC